MMRPFSRLAGTLLVSAILAGCGKNSKTEAPAATQSTSGTESGAAAKPSASGEILPGASSVRSALAKKDYETAVGALLVLKRTAAPGPQTEEFSVVYNEVKLALIEASPTDPKAANAMALFRAATAGR
jgi:hypothetical protein